MSRVLLVVAADAMVAVGSFAQTGPLVCPQDTATAFPAVEVVYTYVYVHFVDAWGNECVMGPYYKPVAGRECQEQPASVGLQRLAFDLVRR